MTNSRSTPLHLACEEPWSTDIRVVEVLISSGAGLLIADNTWRLPLHLACTWPDTVLRPNIEVAACLLEANSSPQHVNARGGCHGWTPLHRASIDGHGELVALLLRAGADEDARDSDAITPLFCAVESSQPVIVQQLLTAGADPCAVDGGHRSVLHMAAMSGDAAILQQLLMAAMVAGRLGEVVDAVADGMTALHLAVENGHTRCVPLLLAAGADANLLYRAAAEVEGTSLEGATVLHRVVELGHVALVPLLATPTNLRHEWLGETPLHLALATDCPPSIVQALVFAGAPVGVPSTGTMTAMFMAACSTNLEIQALLPAMVWRECWQHNQLQQVGRGQQQQQQHKQQEQEQQQHAMGCAVTNVGNAVDALLRVQRASSSTRDSVAFCIKVVKEVLGRAVASQVVDMVLLACHPRDEYDADPGTSKELLLVQGLSKGCCAALEPLMQQRWRVTNRLHELVTAPLCQKQQQQQQPASAAAGASAEATAGTDSQLSAQAMAAAAAGQWPLFVQLWEQVMGMQPVVASSLMSEVEQQVVTGELPGVMGLCSTLLEAWEAAQQQLAGRMRQELVAGVLSAVQLAASRRRGWSKQGAKPIR
jgi:ankyrin repeat protein